MRRRIKRNISQGQGFLGAACLAGGLFLVAGLGWSLIALGAVLLFAAWSSS